MQNNIIGYKMSFDSLCFTSVSFGLGISLPLCLKLFGSFHKMRRSWVGAKWCHRTGCDTLFLGFNILGLGWEGSSRGLRYFGSGLPTFGFGLRVYGFGLRAFGSGVRGFGSGLLDFRSGVQYFRSGLRVLGLGF